MKIGPKNKNEVGKGKNVCKRLKKHQVLDLHEEGKREEKRPLKPVNRGDDSWVFGFRDPKKSRGKDGRARVITNPGCL